jgi:hypothetical protein
VFGVGVIAVEICWMILKRWIYVDKLYKFVRMKKKLTLLVDAVLIDRMKEHAAARELSMSLLVEQFFAQQLSHKERLEASIELSGEDRFISKFGGIASDFGAMSDAEIKELVFLERLKKHS